MNRKPSRSAGTGSSTRWMEESLNRSRSSIFASYRLVGAILLFGIGGYLLDRWLTTSPWFLVAGLLVGVAIGLLGLFRLVRR